MAWGHVHKVGRIGPDASANRVIGANRPPEAAARLTPDRISDNLAGMKALSTASTVVLSLCLGCTGSHEMGEPWGSPMQFSTALPDRPEAPRDLAMFNGDTGRVLVWADLMRLSRRSDIVVVSAPEGTVPDMVRRALFDDISEAFPPVTELTCSGDVEPCAASVVQADGRRRLVRCGAGMDLAALSASIRAQAWGKVVTTVALVPGTARTLQSDEKGRADVVVRLGTSPPG